MIGGRPVTVWRERAELCLCLCLCLRLRLRLWGGDEGRGESCRGVS